MTSQGSRFREHTEGRPRSGLPLEVFSKLAHGLVQFLSREAFFKTKVVTLDLQNSEETWQLLRPV